MSFDKACEIYLNTLEKVIMKEDGRMYPLLLLPGKYSSYQHSKNVWVLGNCNGRMAIVNIEKETVRPNFFQPNYKKWTITCRLRRKSYSNGQGIIETPQIK